VPDDDTHAVSVAVLTHRYWQRAFGGDPAAVGRVVSLNGTPFTTVGVAEPSFTRLTPGNVYDLWLPALGLLEVEEGPDPVIRLDDEDGPKRGIGKRRLGELAPPGRGGGCATAAWAPRGPQRVEGDGRQRERGVDAGRPGPPTR
jgi:hypothetical protein